MKTSKNTFVVAALYKFAPLPDFANYRAELTALGEDTDTTGTLLLAAEGINGTIAGSRQGIDRMLARLRSLPGCGDLDVKESYASSNPFLRMKVRLKREIVTMGVVDIDAANEAGTYVEPAEWNELISRPDVVVVDTRNDYEVDIGTFTGAVNPETQSFRQFPKWADKALAGENRPKLAMFCTGGIRCEKATAYMKSQGFDEVYHLRGGILKYLEEIPEEESLWNGECFVFDRRVSVGHGLKPGPFQLCAICREPFLSGEGEGGYARNPCPTCADEADEKQKRRARVRQEQIDRAKVLGRKHLGPRKAEA